eukprot:TRINITY_DN6084_c0_g1_i1.p1 TRINITY_DN6084_c0_g1~~TRINITY_DN6084_c0_g1_i1.p1  ORF type:complete len:428 (+),score=16.88 TRINITY_DN6084_c0_g1_i1:150-1286(+)
MEINVEALLTSKNISFEHIHFESDESDIEIDREVNTDVRETGQFTVLLVNDELQLALVSANYNLNTDQIKLALKAQKLGIAESLPSQVASPLPDISKLLIDSNLCGQIEEVCIQVESKLSFLKVKISDILSKYEGNCEVVNMKLLPKYKIKTKFVDPKLHQNKFDLLQSGKVCIFGVSLGSQNYTRARILAQLERITKDFSHCIVLIIDSGHRLNLASQDVRQDYALDYALEMGQNFIHRHKATFQRYSEHCEFKFVLGSQVQKHPQYNTFYHQLKNFYQKDENFRASLCSFSTNFQHKKNFGLSESELFEKINNSNEYFFEELAIFACVYKQMNITPFQFFYPGVFTIFAEILTGKFPGILKELLNFALIQIIIKKR